MLGIIALTSFISTLSGLWGVLVTDLLQFGIAMTASFAAAYFAVQQPQVGGLSGLFAKVPPALASSNSTKSSSKRVR